jgi:hypothetical protein
MADAVERFSSTHSKEMKLKDDPVKFFKRSNLDPEFERYVKSKAGKVLGRSATQAIKSFTSAL